MTSHERVDPARATAYLWGVRLGAMDLALSVASGVVALAIAKVFPLLWILLPAAVLGPPILRSVVVIKVAPSGVQVTTARGFLGRRVHRTFDHPVELRWGSRGWFLLTDSPWHLGTLEIWNGGKCAGSLGWVVCRDADLDEVRWTLEDHAASERYLGVANSGVPSALEHIVQAGDASRRPPGDAIPEEEP